MPSEPRATYRVQLGPGFGFPEAAALVPYLAALGVSHLYCSPYMQAGPGSTHGYDVVDPGRISDDLGGPGGQRAMVASLARHGMAHIVDIVPNHMAVAGNRWWRDVLRHGRQSRYASFFDIDWDPPERRLTGKVLLPVLGDHYGRVLEAGELVVDDSGDEPEVRYHEHSFPLAPGSVHGSAAALNSDWAALHDVLERQHYRLAYWRTDLELNYRRFFDIDELVALHSDRPEVFDAVHGLVLELVDRGDVDGLRVDHVDGLRDPGAYLETLRARAGDAYIVAEKILEHGETLPPDWPVEGTTGYDFLNRALGVLVDSSGCDAITDVYETFVGETVDLDDLVTETKLAITETVLAADVERLTARLSDACQHNLRYRDFARAEMREAVRETLASLPVYRTYVRPGSPPRPEDARTIADAVDAAAARRPDLDDELFEFLGRALVLAGDSAPEIELALRFQQTSGSVMAKAVEDTVYYLYNRFVCLNEVGGDPGRFGLEVAEFHGLNERAAAAWPLSMAATSTHDTKRSEDVRARLALLAEIPDRWDAAVRRFAAINERYRRDGLPDRNTEYLFYQTVVGAHPLDAARAGAYMEKATREGKRHTSWTDPNPGFDDALQNFVAGALADPAFAEAVQELVEPLVPAGRINSLAQTLFKLTCPGVADIYQGTELWDLSLVDPDNRRPVDYGVRARLLDAVADAAPDKVMADSDSGAPKLWLIARALALRARRPEPFGPAGGYEPVAAEGPAADYVVAYGRGGAVVAVAPRLPLSRPPWGSTELVLPPGTWRDVLSGRDHRGRAPVAEVTAEFPVALLERL